MNSLTEKNTHVNCMMCLANLAAGIPHDGDEYLEHNGITHGTNTDIGPGIIRILCKFELRQGVWTEFR